MESGVVGNGRGGGDGGGNAIYQKNNRKSTIFKILGKGGPTKIVAKNCQFFLSFLEWYNLARKLVGMGGLSIKSDRGGHSKSLQCFISCTHILTQNITQTIVRFKMLSRREKDQSCWGCMRLMPSSLWSCRRLRWRGRWWSSSRRGTLAPSTCPLQL